MRKRKDGEERNEWGGAPHLEENGGGGVEMWKKGEEVRGGEDEGRGKVERVTGDKEVEKKELNEVGKR